MVVRLAGDSPRKAHVGVSIKCRLCNLNMSTKFCETPEYQISQQIRSAVSTLAQSSLKTAERMLIKFGSAAIYCNLSAQFNFD